MQMTALRKWNDGYNYVLVVVDVFTKYAWAIPLKTKGAGEVSKAFAALFNRIPTPECLQTDQVTKYNRTQHI